MLSEKLWSIYFVQLSTLACVLALEAPPIQFIVHRLL